MQRSIRASRLLNWGTFSGKITSVPAGSCVVELRISASTKGSAAALAVDTPGPAASETLSTQGLACSWRVDSHDLNELNGFWCFTEADPVLPLKSEISASLFSLVHAAAYVSNEVCISCERNTHLFVLSGRRNVLSKTYHCKLMLNLVIGHRAACQWLV